MIRRHALRPTFSHLAAGLFAAGLVSASFTGCDDGYDDAWPTPGAETLSQKTHADVGTYVATGANATLYIFTNDTKGSATADPTSACTAGCLDAWPVHYDASPKVGAGLNSADFGSFKRTDGTWQSTYKGWPLYTHTPDAAGDVSGHGKGGTWYAAGALPAPAPTFAMAYHDTVGDHIVTADGFSVYIKADDTKGASGADPSSSCSDACLDNYPLLHVTLDTVGADLNKDDFGWFTRADGLKQSTYKGWPLYTYHADDAGDLYGHDNNGVWFAAGTPIPAPQ